MKTKTWMPVAAVACAVPLMPVPSHARGATAPYNEAVKMINGKRVVELPSIPAHVRRGEGSWSKPGEDGVEGGARNAIETPQGLMDCRGIYGYDPKACVPSNYGKVVQARQWVVKLNGRWQVCVGRAKPIKCKAIDAFAFLPMVRE